MESFTVTVELTQLLSLCVAEEIVLPLDGGPFLGLVSPAALLLAASQTTGQPSVAMAPGEADPAG